MTDPSAGGRRNKSKRGGRPGNSSGGDGRSRKRRKRRRRGKGKGGGMSTADRMPPSTTHRDDNSVLGGRVPQAGSRPRQFEGPPDGFRLFMTYYLGVTPDDGYQRPSLDETARRLGLGSDEVKQLLVEHRLDPETMASSTFDLEAAKLDIRVAPEGISRTELARELYDWYLDCVGEPT